uniref:Complement C3 n=1 Tax=Leptobrachium leishanense TaxID=445787 RepID=A0A8C5MNS2_9ANUR
MGCTVLCLGLLALITGSYAQPTCALITSSVLRVGSEETIILDAQGQKDDFNADILIQDFPQKKSIFAETKVSLNKANGFLGTAKVTISAKDLKKEQKKKQYVHIIVKAPECPLDKVVLVSFQNGYIFIQTDKPLYTPGSQVLFRTFIVGFSLLPDSRFIEVEVNNPEGIAVYKTSFSAIDKSGIVSKSYKLPEIANVGIWQITSRFQDAPQEIFRAEFEVKEYVLPSFEVLLETSQNHFFVDDNELTVDITANFLHGKPVNGTIHAIFGVVMNNEKRPFPASLTKIPMEMGKAQVQLYRHIITTSFPNLEIILGHSLYVTVTVSTNAGSDIVHVEKSNIPVVKSAFKFVFSKTTKYFKPGLPYMLELSLLNPDGSPAPNVEVCLVDWRLCSKTFTDGIATIVVNIPDKAEVELQVQTKANNVPEHRQATGTVTLQSYKSQNALGNYLHIDIFGSQATPGNNMRINFIFKNPDNKIQDSIEHLTYLILGQGRILEAGRLDRQGGQSLVVKSLLIKENFLPSFRIVAYYMLPSDNEIVADSALVDVTDSCIRPVEIFQDPTKLRNNYEPGSPLSLRIKGDAGAHVALGAVDRAVFVLNRKNRLTQSKVWRDVRLSDLGCTPGGGSNNAGVFTDAGLSIDTTKGLKTSTRSAQKYQAAHLRQCCQDGMEENPMKYTCQRRAQYVLDGGECVEAFLDCCKQIHELKPVRGGFVRRKGNKPFQAFIHQTGKIISAGEAEKGDDNEEYREIMSIVSRSIFSESWLWKVETLPLSASRDGYAYKTVNTALPDSMTTWEFLAISMSPTSGICVATPYNVTVRKEFFLDMRLPYSVVRNEQVAIQVVLYSYVDNTIEVLVDLMYKKEMCSASTRDNNFRQVVSLEPHGSTVISFVIVPLTIGDLEVEVKALVRDILMTDGVTKKLKVVPEGIKLMKTIQSIVLDPLRSEKTPGVQTVTINPIPVNDIVPNSEPETYVSLKGDLLGETLENSIDGSKLNHLIMMPAGCGEQNMMSMTPSVIATRYLDVTNQWETIGLHRREESIKTINQGYVQQLVYRKSDNSYSAFTNRPPSTWLTAYVVKVFSMAFQLIYIEKDVLCGAVQWLIQEKQLSNGAFKEDAPVIHGEMVGGSGRTDPDASLTAFVLIALSEAREICKSNVPDLPSAVSKSAEYLESRLKTLKKPYSVCIVSYALALVGKLSDHNLLMRVSDESTHWAELSSDLYSIEATSYGMLALLKLGHHHLTEPIAQWLTEQRFYGGGYGSTQATIMVFQAMSEYQAVSPLRNEVNMDVTLSLPGRRSSLSWRIDKETIMLQRSEKTSMKGTITVSAVGKGQGTLTVMSVYYSPMAEGAVPCNNFDFSVALEDVPEAKRPEGVLKSIYINICMKFIGNTDSTMTIVDVSMLTGFKPDMNDLNKLTNKVERYISMYEMDTDLSDRGSLIIYLDKVSRTETECLKFKIHQEFEVGILQPAAVTIYEYYSTANRCTKFYHPTEDQAELPKICRGAECHCVAEKCNLKNSHKKNLDFEELLKAACESTVDYVYETNLEKINKAGAYDVYTMVITKVLKLGTDDKVRKDSKRDFYCHRTCRDSLKLHQCHTYFIWGSKEDIWDSKDETSYVLNGGTWIEEMPTNEECDKSKADLCKSLFLFADHLMLLGCQS